ncbi:MAG: substrate-binding domain-containing protein [Chloroflexota bacterium]|nr:substrate-binding domain-containing protein [Chloroflexota bacterium]
MAIITRFALLGALLIAFSSLGLAQGSETAIKVTGSSITNSLLRQLADASAYSLEASEVGSARGIDLFCNGDFDLATSTREMTEAEATICDANEVIFSQLLLGHQLVAFAAHLDAPDTCLTASNLDDLFKPTASHQLKDWSFAGDEHTELPLTIILPAQDNIAYGILDSQVVGDGLRLDGAALSADAVGETAGALALRLWSPELTEDATTKLLQLRDASSGQCFSPSVAAVENGQYLAAQSHYVYLNRARLDASEYLLRFLEFVVEPGNARLVAAAGINPPSDSIYALNADLLADAEAMPLFSGDESAYRIPPALTGTVRIVGAANAYQPLNSTGEQLTSSHPQLQMEYHLAGSQAGIADLCAGAAELAMLDSELPTDACADAGVSALPLPVGAQATILLGNAGDGFSACLTSEQIAAIWRAESAGSLEEWAGLGEEFPQRPLTLFGLRSLDAHTDILLGAAGEPVPPVRRDTEQDHDANYRAAAVANVPGALTYMTWAEYEAVLTSEQANILAVAVDSGAGCISPSLASISDGTYALARPASLLVSEAALADVNVQSLLWSLYGDDNWTQVAGDGFIGLSALDLPALRRDLQMAFRSAEEADSESDATEEADSE